MDRGVYCNRTPTALEQKWTEQESRRAENPKNPLDKRDFRQSRTQQETRDLTYKEGVAGRIEHRPRRGVTSIGVECSTGRRMAPARSPVREDRSR
jgi:hypothetical protein